MRLLIVIACLVACAAAECNRLSKLKVKAQWEEAYGTETSRTALATSVFRYLMSKSPASRDLFDRVGGDDDRSAAFIAHMHRVTNGLDECISLLNEDEPLQAQLDHLARQHDRMEIPTQYFHVFNEGLLLAVHATLGRCFDEEAWSSCLEVIEAGIVGHRGD